MTSVKLRETHYEGRFADDIIRELTSPLTRRDALYSMIFVDVPPYSRTGEVCRDQVIFDHDRRPDLFLLVDERDVVVSATAVWNG
jgi:hypothetical protein